MKIEKVTIVVIVLIIVIILFSIKKKDESSWWLFSKPKSTPTPSMAGCVNCWVSSVEDGVEYCRWYDNFGRNTSTYEGRGCTGVQANIGFGYGAKKKRKWWEMLFG